jgi:hypothetical protein
MMQKCVETQIETAVFWDVAPCSDVEGNRRVGGTYWFHRQGDVSFDEGGSKFL